MKDVIVTAASNLINAIVSAIFNDKIVHLKSELERSNFIKKIDAWCSDFVDKNDMTIVSSHEFAECVKNYSIIETLINFYISPKGIKEEEFLDVTATQLYDRVKDKRAISVSDKNIVFQFVKGIYSVIEDYYESIKTPENTATYHKLDIISGMEDRIVDKILSRSTDVVVTKKHIDKVMFSYPENTIKRLVADFSDVQKG